MNLNRITMTSLFASLFLSLAACNQMPPIPANAEATPQVSNRQVMNLSTAVFQTQTVDSAGEVGQYSSMVLNSAGNPVISYYDATRNASIISQGPYGNGDLKLAVCGNPTCTSGNTVTTVDRGHINTDDAGRYTSLVLDSRGYPVISYVDRNSGLKLAHCGDATCTSRNSIKVVVTASHIDFAYTSLVLDRNGNPFISYGTGDSKGYLLTVVRCGDTNCSSRNAFAQVQDSATHSSLGLDFKGNPVISYYEPRGGDLKLARCDFGLYSGTCTSQIVDNGGSSNVGQYNSLKMVGIRNNVGAIVDRIPFISYYDATNGDLKAVSCGNAGCTNGNTITTVDSAGDVGQYTSVSKDGAFTISYYDASNHALKLVSCDPGSPYSKPPTAPCQDTTRNQLETVDSTGDVGQYNSLALDSKGNPVISYFDATKNDARDSNKESRASIHLMSRSNDASRWE
jgi:hypothetical protein